MNDEWLTRELRAAIQCHQALLRATDEQQLLDSICQIVCAEAGYYMAWVAFAVDDPDHTTTVAASAGHVDHYFDNVEVRWGESEWARCPIGRAITQGDVSRFDNFLTDPDAALWRDEAVARGYVSCIGLPLVGDDGSVFGALGVYSDTEDRFDDAEVELLRGLANDLAFGINALRRRAVAHRQNALFRAAFETSPDAKLITRVEDGLIGDVNQGFLDLFGWSREEVLGNSVLGIGFWADPHDREVLLESIRNQGSVQHLVRDFRRKDGSELIGDISSRVIDLDGGSYILSVLRDVTGEVESRRALLESEARFRAVSEASHDFIWEIDTDHRYTYVSPKVTEILGYTPEEMLGKRPYDFMAPDVAPEVAQEFTQVAERRGTHVGLVNINVHKDGHQVALETNATPIFDPDGEYVGYRGADRDITDRIRVEEELRASNEMLTQSQHVARLGHYVFEPQYDRWSSSEPLDSIFGIDGSYVKDVAGWLDIIHPLDQPRMAEYVADHVLQQHLPFDTRYRIVRKDDGEERIVHGLGELEFNERGDVVRMFGVIQDITEGERIQEELRASEERYRSISETVTSFVYSCIRSNGEAHRIDWIAGAVEPLSGYPVSDFHQMGCWKFIVHPDDLPIFEERVCSLASGEAATAEFRIVHADGSHRWVRSTASASPLSGEDHSAGDAQRVIGSVEDITERRHAELDLMMTNVRLEGVLKSLTETMGKVVEARDPYTEGHERGVARIARQIAERMGLTDDEIEAIEVAATVHDVGKLAIPAEILSKPNRLSAIEYQFVQQHSKAGHDILSGIDYGWPIAEIVHQHHERMDGSGYPRGLVGDEIMLAARVIMVADVVDAMACHRPYRPALGLDAAVAEIQAHPEKYDKRVTDALAELYSEGAIAV